MLLVAMLTTATFAACSDDKDTGSGPSVSVTGLTVSESTLSVAKDGGQLSFGVQSPVQPTVTSDQSWCTVTVGTISQKLKVTPVTVSVDALGASEISDRTANLTVTAGAQTQTVTITQRAGDRIVVSPATVTVPAAGGNFKVNVTANGTYTVSIDQGWLTQAVGYDTPVFTAAPNGLGARTATITFTLNKEVATVVVTQEAGEPANITATAMDIAKQMYPAWNLGNTMEGGDNANLWTNNGGVAAETSWQSTKTTQQIIDYVKSLGFKSVRIPTSWVMGHITNADEVTIDPAWMQRVKEVVDYGINSGLYVFINDHWDGGWLENSFGDVSDATVAANSAKLSKLWTQIAQTFKDYDEHLLFGGLNEPGMNGGNFNATTTTALLKYEQVFIDAVRSTGGNNGKRTLVVQGPQTDIEQTCSASNNYDLDRLTDPAGKGYLMVEVHCYTPWTFCGLEADADWGKMMYYWGEGNGSGDRYYANGEAELQKLFKKMYTNFYQKGYPIILGECGANYRMNNDANHDASIKAWYKTIAKESISNGCIPFYWDTNYTGFPNMTIINRATRQVNNQHMLDGITEGLAAATWPN